MEVMAGSLTMEMAVGSLVVAEPHDGGGDGESKLNLNDDEIGDSDS